MQELIQVCNATELTSLQEAGDKQEPFDQSLSVHQH